MPITIVTPAAELPITLDMVKKHTVIGAEIGTADDELLTMYLDAAIEYGQNITGRTFVETGYQMDLEEFPTGKIKLLPDLQSVASVKYTDSDDQQITLAVSEYKVRKTHLVGYIEPVTSWPYGAEDILIDFNAGWPLTGDPATTPTTPKDIQAWLAVRVAGMYMQRENFIIAGSQVVTSMPADFIDSKLSTKIVPGYGAGI